MKNLVSMFYSGSAELSLHDVNRILQSIVALSDFVWINCDTRISRRILEEESKHICNLIEGLIDSKKIKKWGYPFQEGADKVSQIVEPSDYNEIEDKINEVFLSEEDLLAKVSLFSIPKRQSAKDVETTAKIISIRKDYWTLALSHLLGADRIMIDPHYKYSWQTFSQRIKYSKIESELARYVIEDLASVTDMSKLDVADIVALQDRSKLIREKLDSLCNRSSLELMTDTDMNEMKRELKEEYLNSVARGIDELCSKKNLIKQNSYTIMGILIPQVNYLNVAESFRNWYRRKRDYGLTVFTSELWTRVSKKKLTY